MCHTQKRRPQGSPRLFNDHNDTCYIQKGDRKGPHPSSSSTPASTMTTTEWLIRPFSFKVEAGDEGMMGGDPCGRLSPTTLTRHY